jgi:hypothetical protein
VNSAAAQMLDDAMILARAAELRERERKPITDAEWARFCDWPRSCDEGWVYFVQSGDAGPIKIGFAFDIEKRLAQLQVGNPETLHLRGAYRGTIDAEVDEHERFDASRLRGEWFHPTSELLVFIERLA